MRRSRSVWMVELLVAVSAAALACTSPDGGDGGATDGGAVDAGTPDAGAPDAGIPDAGTPDAGTPDAGTPDAGTPDAGTPDAGTGSDYKLDPPNACYAHWDLASTVGCKKGDPTSPCGGVCDSANACNPPEGAGDPNDPYAKVNLPKTFACPRMMLFSNEMIQAAKDDTVANGWGDPSNPPFNYAVVGHDADRQDPDNDGPLLPLDDGDSTCCQCYQLVFETPEPGSDQPPLLPIPKPLIVQSFNTAAGGGNNFDIFMGAGGFGAFNACVPGTYNAQTTKFGEFMYSSFPYQFDGNGGIKFINIDECKSGGKATIDLLKSPTCQNKIAQYCDATVGNSAGMTASTKNSCKYTNRPESAYHQNWFVRVKKVECPEALTRVTGCKLEPQGLAKPDPKAQTPATADASFRVSNNVAGTAKYTTTTMQDCCKPTCAWHGNVALRGLKPSGKWKTFYSCDKNGTPFTAP